MIATLAFSIVATGLVFLAGRKDPARDPKLTVALLVLLGATPVMAAVMPKLHVFPAVVESTQAAAFPWGEVLAAGWAVGFVIALARLAGAAICLRRWQDHSSEVTRVDGITVRVRQDLRSPVAAGILHPVIFVPTSWSTWPAAYQRVVLEHELAHHRRRDPLCRLLAELVCAVHWYHPLVRWMTTRFNMQCEYACDAMVLEKGVDPKTYATVLCDFAGGVPVSPLAPAMAEGCPLESRVRRMFHPASRFSGRELAVLAICGLLAACSLSLLGSDPSNPPPIPAGEIRLRLTANPFPGN